MIQFGLTELQITERRTCIGGSDAGAIVAGGEEWIKLWREKTDRADPDDLSDVLAVQMGIFTEPLNCYWYERQTGRKVTHRNKRAVHPDYPFIAANLDGVSTTTGAQTCYLDFKHLGKSGDALTIRYTAQGTHCASIIGAEWWALSCFIGNSRWELTEQEVEPEFLAEYLERCREFWSFVERDVEPPGAEPLPVPAPRQLRTVRLDDEIDWPNWGADFAEEMDTFTRTEPAARANHIARGRIKELLPEDVGTVVRRHTRVTRSRNDAIRITTGGEK